MSVLDTIKSRTSCRTFKPVPLSPADKHSLEAFIRENDTGLDNERIPFTIIGKKAGEKPMKLDYGIIRGHSTYVMGASKASVTSRVNYGYLMEKVVLKATEMSLATCWVGYFDQDYFNADIKIESGYEIPSIVVIGYPTAAPSLLDKVVRFSAKSARRQAWDGLFFNYHSKAALSPESVKKYSDSLEMVRLAPSSGNTQPWRVFSDDTVKEFHFYKKPVSKRYEAKGLHEIDIGIAMSHFELVSVFNGLSGGWIKHTEESVTAMDDLRYIATWKWS
jgi:nitroreductase